MDFLELVKQRQSVRKFTTQPIEKEKLERCIEAVRLAPSACNAQPWKYIIVDNIELKQKIATATKSTLLNFNKFTKDCPALIVVVRETPNFTSKVGAVLKDKPYPIMDIGISVAHFCLQATAEGLGTCIMGWFNENKIKELLGVPSSKRIDLIIAVGYAPADYPLRKKIRKKTEQIIAKNGYK